MIPELISLKLGSDWIVTLLKKLKGIRKNREEELDAINNVLMVDPLLLANYYVEPNCQELNPANREDDDFLVSSEPIMKKIDQFFSVEALPDTGRKQMFILSDAGMGKTSLLVMLKLLHLSSFWPKGKHCEIMKLEQDTIDLIRRIKEARETILLLDALDEDPTAFGKVKERILEILQATRHFHRTIITCRTQYFPQAHEDKDIHEDPLVRLGIISIGGFSCPVKYLSNFTPQQQDAYLSKVFPRKYRIFRPKAKIRAAKSLIEKMGSLRCRPMLLSHIRDLMEAKNPEGQQMDTEYGVYKALIGVWLDRERAKPGNSMSADVLWDACKMLAMKMHLAGQRSISGTDLESLIREFQEIAPVKDIDIKGRSLLNRNSDGHYRFSHYSIQEFLIVEHVLKNTEDREEHRIRPTDVMFRILLGATGKWGAYLKYFDLSQASYVNLFPEKDGLRFIQGGKYLFGEGKKEGRVEPYYIGIHPVTCQEYREFNPSHVPSIGNDQPATGVSWEDAVEYCNWLSKKTGKCCRLPTEIEWEYACRAGSIGDYSLDADGNEVTRENLTEYAVFGKAGIRSVQTRIPNFFGLYDMHGNVWEWCQDWYDEKMKYRVLRGGSWVREADSFVSSFRYGYRPVNWLADVGFRLVVSVARTLP